MSESERRPAWLDELLSELPRELEPERDLWPAIAQRLHHRHAQRVPWALAAGIALTATLALFAWQSWRTGPEDALATLRQSYETARAQYRDQLPMMLAELPPETASEIRRNLDVVDQAIRNIEGALAQDPADPALRRVLQLTYEQELALYERLRPGALDQI